MYCPACDKEFSPVHSRCPECKGWLRVSGPTVGAKAGPAIRSAPASSQVETQKVGPPPAAGANVPLPSRPSKPAVAATAPPLSPPISRVAAASGFAEVAAVAAPVPAVSKPALEPVEPTGPRGALGSGWESNNSLGGAPSGWGSTTTAVPAAPAPPVGGLGGWGAPAAAPSPVPPVPSTLGQVGGLGGGWGMTNAQETGKMQAWGNASGSLGPPPTPSLGLGGPPAVGLNSGGLPSGALGMPPAPPSGSLGPPPSGSMGGGWLGDGGNSSPYSPPARSGGGWLGDGVGGGEAAPLSMPSAPPMAPSLGPATEASVDALSLPDHTVAVDLYTPWEEEFPVAAPSNKAVYGVLALFLVVLVGFFGYLYHTQKVIRETPVAVDTPGETPRSLDAAVDNYRQAQKFYSQNRFQEAQSFANTAHLLVNGLTVKDGDKKVVREIQAFYARATSRLASHFMSQARSARERNAAIGFAEQAAAMYHEMGSKTSEAEALGLQGDIYMRFSEFPNAQIAYGKAAKLNPGGGYRGKEQSAKDYARPQVDTQTNPDPVTTAPVPVEIPANPYPVGRPQGGGHHAAAPAPVAPPPAIPATKPRPVNTYVPPRKDNRPSFMRRGSDVLPTYNH